MSGNNDIESIVAIADEAQGNIRDDIRDYERALAPYRVQSFNPAVLAADTSTYESHVDFLPDFWIVVAQFTAGYATASAGSGGGAILFRLVNKRLRFPVKNDVLTVKTVGATGLLDIYAVKGLEGFDIG